MKVVFVCEYYWPHIGGAEVVFSQLALKLTGMGHECHVITCKLRNTAAYEIIDGVKIHRVSVPRKGDRYWFALLAIPEVLKIARKAGIIHTTTFTAAIPAWFASTLLRKKCIITVLEVWGNLWNELGDMNHFSILCHKISEKIIVSLPFDKYCCISNYTQSCLLRYGIGINGNKCVTIYNGVDYELFNPSHADGTRIRKKLGFGDDFIYLYFGRPGISKGLEYLIQAVPLISSSIPKSKLLLILSKDPQVRYTNIISMIKELAIENRVVLLEPVPRNELPSYIAAVGCVVVPSISEGFGFSAAEACAMGKPVVASNIGSLPEVVSGRYVLIEPRSPEAIARGVEKVYKGEVEDKGKKTFIWDECVKNYLGLYAKILSIKEKRK